MSQFEQLSEHIWVQHAEHETDRPLLAAIAGANRTVLLDAGASPAHAAQFRRNLSERGLWQPDFLVLTHWHWDHTFGMSEWQIPVITVRETKERLRLLRGLSWTDEALDDLVQRQVISEASANHIRLEYRNERNIEIMEPDILFEHKMILELGGVECELHHVGGDHSEDCCFLYVKEDKTLFLGDALGPSVYGGPNRYSSSHFFRLMEEIFRYDAQIFVESHAHPAGEAEFRQDIGRYVQLARFVEEYRRDREQIEEQMKQYLQVQELPGEFSKAIDWFLTD